MRELYLVTLSGTDKIGITNRLTEVLADHNVNILDIGQAVIHDTLSLGFLIELSPYSESATVFRDLLYKTHELGLVTKFTPISLDEYEHWVSMQGKPRYIITLLGPQIEARHVFEISEIILSNGLNIDSIKRLSGRKSLLHLPSNLRSCIEFTVRGVPGDIDNMRSRFLDSSRDLGIDISFQVDNVYRRNRRLVAFDMDSTLIQVEVIDELAKAAGVGEKVSAITEHHRGVAISRKWIEFGVPPHRTLEVSVCVDDAWSNVGTTGIEHGFTIGDEVCTDLSDYASMNTNIGFVRGCTSSVDDCSAGD
jgi:phosphoserine phosphatase